MDSNDPMLGGYYDLKFPSGWELSVSERAPLSEIYNRVYRDYPGRAWFGVLADDVVPESPDWDRRLIAAAGSDGLGFGDDGINGPRHATHFVLGGDLVREMGWLALPGLDRIFIDTVWNDIARERGVLRYLPDVVLKHRHFSNGLALRDAVYRKPNKERDREIYEQWKGRL